MSLLPQTDESAGPADIKELVGVVAIGRNEGQRLHACLASCLSQVPRVVYVDSGSTDGSVASARSLGADVVELETDLPFSAARARNKGLRRLKATASHLRYVQFIDGDCVLASGWLEAALEQLNQLPQAVVVCGRRSESRLHASVYNRLIDLEWDTPIGPAEACGGDALMRVEAFEQVGGYDPNVVAGEEPELCFRLRQKGWRVYRIDVSMTLHDVALHHFAQWWRRAARAGHAYGQAVALHGGRGERFRLRATISIWAWAVGLPVLSAIGYMIVGPLALILLAAYPLLIVRIALRQRSKRNRRRPDAWLYAAFCVIAKFAQCQGQCHWWWHWLRGCQPTIMEYKSVDGACGNAAAKAEDSSMTLSK